MGTGASFSSAAPASGKYGGFGSEDIAKFGYQPGKFNAPYDPYTKNQALHTDPTPDIFAQKPKKKRKSTKKKRAVSESSDSDEEKSSDDSDDSDESSEEEEKQKKSKKKQKEEKKKTKSSKGLEAAPKADRKLSGTAGASSKPQSEPNLFDLIDQQ